jgi:hypothetical protein
MTNPEDAGRNVCACSTQAHGGASVGGAARELADPSAPNFCRLVTGSDFKRKASSLVCLGFEKVHVLEKSKDGQRKCQAHFCESGKAGYEQFVTNIFGWLRENLRYVLVILLVFAIGEAGRE